MFTEYGADNGISMKIHFDSVQFEGKERIVEYLKTGGKTVMVSMARPVDRITGERINGLLSLELMSDGNFRWYNDLAYHVEKYNLRLPEEFEKYVLNKSNQP